jgi:hypothetical protein
VELAFGLNEIWDCEQGKDAEEVPFHGGGRRVRKMD